MSKNDPPILSYAQHGKTEKVKECLRAGVPADIREREQCTPLMLAALYGHRQVCQLLLAYGADVMARSVQGETPLTFAAVHGDVKTIQVLIDAGAQVNAVDSSGRTPLFQAAYSGHDKAIELLLNHGADPEIVATRGDTALDYAMSQGQMSTVELLLDGLSKNPGSDLQKKLLCWASEKGASRLVRKLLAAGADPNSAPQYYSPPLACALRSRDLDTVKILIEANAGLGNVENAGLGSAPTALLDYVLKQGIHLNSVLMEESGAEAALAGKIANLELLIAADPASSLKGAVRGALSKPDMMDWVLRHGGNANTKLPGGKLLHVAAGLSAPEIVHKLVHHGASINEMDDAGMTPLLVAARAGQLDNVNELLAQGAALSMRNNLQQNVLMLAAESGNCRLLEFLIDKGVDVNASDVNGATALSFATSHPSNAGPMTKILLKNGARANTVEQEQSPLLNACAFGLYNDRYGKPRKKSEDKMAEAIQALLAAGADPNVAYKAWPVSGRTALSLARELRAPEVERWLIKAGARE